MCIRDSPKTTAPVIPPFVFGKALSNRLNITPLNTSSSTSPTRPVSYTHLTNEVTIKEIHRTMKLERLKAVSYTHLDFIPDTGTDSSIAARRNNGLFDFPVAQLSGADRQI